ncbi:hypothetical protein DL96DRAFT_1706125 [Flagelloscypha sp. PMI_526]|nr:hypothetical protein DL96DRAFT_1706125 [Flagelloscypha sp. PMI_526]
MVESIVSLFVPFYESLFYYLYCLREQEHGAEAVYLHIIRPLVKPYVPTLDLDLDLYNMIQQVEFFLLLYGILYPISGCVQRQTSSDVLPSRRSYSGPLPSPAASTQAYEIGLSPQSFLPPSAPSSLPAGLMSPSWTSYKPPRSAYSPSPQPTVPVLLRHLGGSTSTLQMLAEDIAGADKQEDKDDFDISFRTPKAAKDRRRKGAVPPLPDSPLTPPRPTPTSTPATPSPTSRPSAPAPTLSSPAFPSTSYALFSAAESDTADEAPPNTRRDGRRAAEAPTRSEARILEGVLQLWLLEGQPT